MRIYVKVIPKSSKKEVVELAEGQFKVHLNAPPVNGAANRQLVEVLADHFQVAKSSVEIVGGKSARTKIVEIFR